MKRILGGLAITLIATGARAGDCLVDKAAYKAVKNGMTYEQVVAVIGCDGNEDGSMEMNGVELTNYTWKGNIIGTALITVSIASDTGVFMKVQHGL